MARESLLQASQLALVPSPFCGNCPARGICREQFTELGCPPSGPTHPNLLHPLSKDWFPRIVELNGFGLDYPAWEARLPVLPPYIPAIRTNAWPEGLPSSDAFAIPLSQVGPLARNAKEQGITAKQLLGLAEHQLLIVLGFASDRFLEQHWPRRERWRLLASIKSLEPDAAVAWGYSVWHRHVRGWTYPRIEHLSNLKRSLKVYAELQALDIPAIPHVYWGKRDDLDRWAAWLTENPSVTTIAVDLQTVDQPSAWRNAIRALEYLRTSLPRQVHLLVSGVCRRERVLALRRLWPESSLSNLGASFASAFRYKRPYGLAHPWVVNPSHWSKADIFQHVANQYSALGLTSEPCEPRIRLGMGLDLSDNVRGDVVRRGQFAAAPKRDPSGQRAFADIDEQWQRAMARSVA